MSARFSRDISVTVGGRSRPETVLVLRPGGRPFRFGGGGAGGSTGPGCSDGKVCVASPLPSDEPNMLGHVNGIGFARPQDVLVQVGSSQCGRTAGGLPPLLGAGPVRAACRGGDRAGSESSGGSPVEPCIIRMLNHQKMMWVGSIIETQPNVHKFADIAARKHPVMSVDTPPPCLLQIDCKHTYNRFSERWRLQQA